MYLNKTSFFSDVYNYFYLILNKRFLNENHDIIQKTAEQLLLNSNIYKPSNQVLRDMQVKLIQNSKLVREKDPQSKILKSFIKIQREIAIDSLPERILIKSNTKKNDLKIKKEKLKKKYATSRNKQDTHLKKLLINPHVLELAKKMDVDFHEKITMKDFAHLISTQYQEDIDQIFLEEHIKFPGADNYSDLNFALLLLQKNDLFVDAIDELVDFCSSEFKFACIQSVGMGYQNGISVIQPNRY